MTSSIDPEEDNSNMISSSGSSPVLFTDPDAAEVLQVLPSKPTSNEIKSSKRKVPLEPFVHQVGGHFPMVCLAKETLCKPLNEREHKFYKTMPKSLIPFVPRYEGTMRVEVHENDQGYITLTGHPPPNFKSSRANLSIHQQILQLRSHGDLSRSKSRSSLSTHSKEDESEDILDDDVESSTNTTTTSEEVFCNPWALKCHRDHLKKLGLLCLSHSGPSSPPNLVEENQGSEIKKKRPQNYLLLENLVSRYKYPCVLDLKVGARQYADDVSAAKKARKVAKAQSTTSVSLGLRLTGLQVYDHESGSFICQNKYYGRSLNEETFIETIEDFFKYNGGRMEQEGFEDKLRVDVMTKVVSTVQDLITCLGKLETYRFYTASLLITYDGDLKSSNDSSNLSFDVRMIDFAHSTHRGFRDEVVHEGPDNGFIQGLQSLIRILQQLMEKSMHHRPNC